MATGTGDIARALEQFPAVSLSELDERAPLLRRIDNKYAAPHDAQKMIWRRSRWAAAVYLDVPARSVPSSLVMM